MQAAMWDAFLDWLSNSGLLTTKVTYLPVLSLLLA
jgi:hypothetical protein